MGSAAEIAELRRAVEARIARETEILGAVLRLLDRGVRWADWPPELLDLVREALDAGDDPVESAKARVLARHLFRSEPPGRPARIARHSAPKSALAERLRADLAGLVRLGAGLACGRSVD